MTTQALTLVAPVSTSAPTTAATQPSNEAESFASVLASQHEGVDAIEGTADSALTTASHSARDKQKLDTLLETTETTADGSDTALSMIASTLFIAAESASIQQGLRQHIANTDVDAAKPDTLASHGKTTDTRQQRPELSLRHTAQPATQPVLDTSADNTLRFAAIPSPDTNAALAGANTAGRTVQAPAAKSDSTASLLSTAHTTGKVTAATENVKTVFAALPATQTSANTRVESVSPVPETPTVTAAISSATPPITTLTSSATSPVLQGSLNQPLDSPAWGQEFSKTMLTFSRQGIQHAELRLDPPELGPLRISLKLSDNVAHAYIVSAHANVRQAVEQALPQLQNALAQSGLSLGHTDVSDQPSEQAFLFQQQSEGSSSDSAPSSRFEDLLHGRSTSPAEATAPPVRRALPDALVDTFA